MCRAKSASSQLLWRALSSGHLSSAKCNLPQVIWSLCEVRPCRTRADPSSSEPGIWWLPECPHCLGQDTTNASFPTCTSSRVFSDGHSRPSVTSRVELLHPWHISQSQLRQEYLHVASGLFLQVPFPSDHLCLETHVPRHLLQDHRFLLSIAFHHSEGHLRLWHLRGTRSRCHARVAWCPACRRGVSLGWICQQHARGSPTARCSPCATGCLRDGFSSSSTNLPCLLKA